MDGTGERFVEAGTVGQHDQHSIVVAHAKRSQRGGDCAAIWSGMTISWTVLARVICRWRRSNGVSCQLLMTSTSRPARRRAWLLQSWRHVGHRSAPLPRPTPGHARPGLDQLRQTHQSHPGKEIIMSPGQLVRLRLVADIVCPLGNCVGEYFMFGDVFRHYPNPRASP